MAEYSEPVGSGVGAQELTSPGPLHMSDLMR